MSLHIAGVEVDRGTIPMWAGVIGAPLLWAVQFQLSYMLVPWACTHRNVWIIPVVHIVFLALAIYCGVLSWREWRRIGTTMARSKEEEFTARYKFLSALGLMNSALFCLVILAHLTSSFFLDPCWA
jgi:hypothetical protein